MPKYRVFKLNRVGEDFKFVPGTAQVIESDSEGGAIKALASQMGVPPQGFKAERLLLSDTDRQWYLSSTTEKTDPLRRI